MFMGLGMYFVGTGFAIIVLFHDQFLVRVCSQTLFLRDWFWCVHVLFFDINGCAHVLYLSNTEV